MKKLMMFAATVMVLSGSNAFAKLEVGNVNAGVSTNCDPQANASCHNDVAAAPDCPLQNKSSRFAKTAAHEAQNGPQTASTQGLVK